MDAVPTEAPERLPRLSSWSWMADILLAAALAAATVVSARGGSGLPGMPAPSPPPAPVVGHFVVPPLPAPTAGQVVEPLWRLVAAALTALPLAARRRFPLSVFWVALCATLLLHGGAHAGRAAILTFASTLIAAYTVATYSSHRWAALASVVAGGALIGIFHRETLPSVGASYVPFVVVAGVGLIANVISVQKQRFRTLQAEQEDKTREAIEHERARIARELHDVVTHNVSMMVIQAGAARKVLDQSAERAREALGNVEAGGRAAMTELRHMMDLLALDGDGVDSAAGTDLAPQPGLEQVVDLADRVRQTGVPVELTVTGTPASLPAGVDLAAYRVVQEALTNAVKHANGAKVRISIAHRPTGVVVDVADTGGTPSVSATSGSGRGLPGLRDRLAMYGATLQAGPRPTGGYRVLAEFPLPGP